MIMINSLFSSLLSITDEHDGLNKTWLFIFLSVHPCILRTFQSWKNVRYLRRMLIAWAWVYVISSQRVWWADSKERNDNNIPLFTITKFLWERLSVLKYIFNSFSHGLTGTKITSWKVEEDTFIIKNIHTCYNSLIFLCCMGRRIDLVSLKLGLGV